MRGGPRSIRLFQNTDYHQAFTSQLGSFVAATPIELKITFPFSTTTISHVTSTRHQMKKSSHGHDGRKKKECISKTTITMHQSQEDAHKSRMKTGLHIGGNLPAVPQHGI
jgi:hypothetical protein